MLVSGDRAAGISPMSVRMLPEGAVGPAVETWPRSLVGAPMDV